MGDIQNQIKGAGIILSEFEGNARLIPGRLEICWHVNAVMDSTRGLGEDMLRSIDWQDDMSHHADQEQDE